MPRRLYAISRAAYGVLADADADDEACDRWARLLVLFMIRARLCQCYLRLDARDGLACRLPRALCLHAPHLGAAHFASPFFETRDMLRHHFGDRFAYWPHADDFALMKDYSFDARFTSRPRYLFR